MKLLFLAPYPPGKSPSQRYRLEHYLTSLQQNNISYTYRSFLGTSAWEFFFLPGNYLRKFGSVMMGFTKRFFQLFTIYRYDFIYVHREITPIGPPVFEWVIAKIFRKRIIYDFDDAIWIPATSESNKIVSGLKNFKKVGTICKWAYKVSVGNSFLAEYARKFTSEVYIIPTVVDTDNTHNRIQDQDQFTPSIGWTGTFSTLKYLSLVLPVLDELQKSFDFTFIVIADKDPKLPLRKYKFIKWNKEKEAEDLLRFHIGLMPLYDDEISKGKCGFKAIQYMSLGIPAVVSPVGVNAEIVNHGINGFVCGTEADWKNCLTQLLTGVELRGRMGKAARLTIEDRYSVTATKSTFMNLFT